MTSDDPTPRILAAGSALVGLVVLMTRSSPSSEDVLVGLGCLVLWAGFSLVPAPKKKPTLRTQAPSRPPPPEQSAEPEVVPVAAGPRPHRAFLKEVPASASRLPEVPSHRQRITERSKPWQP